MPSLPGFHYKLLLKRVGIALLILMLTRLLFLIMNPSTFSGAVADLLYASLRYDVTTTSILLIPVVLLHLFPSRWNNKSGWQSAISFFFILAGSIIRPFNCIDAAWFPYTQKRTGYDFFALIATGNDVGQYRSVFTGLLVCFDFLAPVAGFSAFMEKRIRRKVQEFAATNPPDRQSFSEKQESRCCWWP